MTKWNGRFAPYDKGREGNDPEKDFPIRDEVFDYEGKERKFEITYRDFGLG